MSNTNATAPPRNPLNSIIAYEAGELDHDQVVELFQDLLDTGLIHSLQGSYQQTANGLLAAGLCS